MKRMLTEQQVLKKMDIPDFRHVTKDKIITFASMLPNMDPEVAKKALEQFPDFAKTSLEVMKEYKALVQIIYVFLTIFLYLLKCPQSLIL